MHDGRCERATRLDDDALLRDGPSGELARHAEGCPACAARLSSLAPLARGLAALREETDEQAAGVDVAAAALRAVRSQPASRPRRLRRRLAFAAPVALALAALWLLLWPGAGSELRLDAPDGVQVSEGGQVGERRGRDLPLSPGATLETSSAQRARVRGEGGWSMELWPSSSVELGADHWRLRAGGLDVVTDDTMTVRIGDTTLRARGRISAEGGGSGEERAMKLTKKYGAAAAAVVAVAVYAGWATLETSAGETRVEAPGGVLVDGKGRALRFGLGGGGSPSDPVARVAGGDGAGRGGDGHASLEGGAFWDEDRDLVLFTVPGEVFDAVTGEPVPSFRVSARALESQGYDQSEPKSWRFDGEEDGRFQLTGLGLGTWRLRVEAQGYAPLALTLPLTELDADPYLTVPLSEGAQLTGQVIDWRGRPVAGAQVGLAECFSETDAVVAGCGAVESRADGTFRLPRLPEGEAFAVHAQHPRYGVASERDVVQGEGETAHIVLQLSGVLRLTGEVTWGPERRPVPSAAVTTGADTAMTDRNGVYEMLVPLEAHPRAFVDSVDGRPIGRAAAHPENRSAWTLQWVDAATHVAELRIDFRLAMEDGRIRGQVTDERGRPVAGLEILLRNTTGWVSREHETFPTRAVTDAQGRYEVTHVPVGAGYRLQQRAAEDAPWQDLGYVNVPDEEPVVANFRLGSGSIRGRFVRRGSGEPLALGERDCSYLGARLEGASAYQAPDCYPDGRFEIRGLPPGTYVVESRVPELNRPVSYEPERVTVAAGAIVADVIVEAEGEEAAVWRFRVLDDAGRFVSGPYLRYHRDNTSFTSNLEVGADGVASASISRVFTTVFLDAAGYESAQVELGGRDPAEVIEVRLSRLGGEAGAP